MKWDISFEGVVHKFPGRGGWVYTSIPNEYKTWLQKKRRAWGMYPITACVGKTTWQTKLMMKKGGGFFVALKKSIREKERISVDNNIKLSIKLK